MDEPLARAGEPGSPGAATLGSVVDVRSTLFVFTRSRRNERNLHPRAGAAIGYVLLSKETKPRFAVEAAPESVGTENWPASSARRADEGAHLITGDNIRQRVIANCTRYFWLAVLMLAPISKGFGDTEPLLEGAMDAQDFAAPMTLERQLLHRDDQFENRGADFDDWWQLLDQDHLLDELEGNASVPAVPAYEFQVLPAGLLYRSYLAGEKEPRMMWSALYDIKRRRTIWETALGGRVGLLRYGTQGAVNPQGFQLDLEGAVFARLLPAEPSTMLEGADFRFGLVNTWREGRLAVKWGYYHVSAHLGDEFLLVNPDYDRINYVRDAAIVGLSADLNDDALVYGEVANALGSQGGAKPWEFQFGAQYAPTRRVAARGAPYFGANAYHRQDFDFRGGLNVIAGWNWIGEKTGERFRIGMQYYRGPSLQYSFFDRSERLIGGGVWFDY